MPRNDTPATCINCGKSFMASSFDSHKKAGRGKFCSRQCAGKKSAKVTDSLKPRIVEMYQNGMDSRQIANLFDCTPGLIVQILRRAEIDMRHGKSHPGARNGMYGRTHTPEAKEKIRQANRRQFSTEEARQRHAGLVADQIAAGRTGKTHNRLEQKFAAILDCMGIVYQQQYRLSRYSYDFYIPSINALVEVHGTFWHADPRFYQPGNLSAIQHRNIANDRRKANCATQHDYRLLVFWEHDINRIVL